MKKITLILTLLVLASTSMADNWVLLVKGETSLTNSLPDNVRMLDVLNKDNYLEYIKAGNIAPSRFPVLVNTDTGMMSVKPDSIAAGKQECKGKWDGGKSQAEIWATDQYNIACSNLCVLASSPIKYKMKAAINNAKSVGSQASYRLLTEITALRVIIDRERVAAGRNKAGANDDEKED